jgi:hypothetical protein
VAVRVTAVPLATSTGQLVVQLSPRGVLLTVPPLLPPTVTVRRAVGGAKVAVTVWRAVMVTTQVPVPLQPPPLQPEKTEGLVAVAVRVTRVL